MEQDETQASSHQSQARLTPPDDPQRVRVRKFLNLLETLPRLCSPTICGTLSQPTTRTEREKFEWSMEQKAILSPANITTDALDCQNLADLNQTWLHQESEMFFSQKTIAPSPATVNLRQQIIRDVTDEEEEDDDDDDDGDDTTTTQHSDDDSDTDIYVDEEDDDRDDTGDQHDDDMDDVEFDDGEDDDDRCNSSKDMSCLDDENQPRDDMESLFFSPEPIRSSQSQQRVDIFSPGTFVRVMEDENTFQSTPRITGSQRSRTRTRTTTEMSE